MVDLYLLGGASGGSSATLADWLQAGGTIGAAILVLLDVRLHRRQTAALFVDRDARERLVLSALAVTAERIDDDSCDLVLRNDSDEDLLIETSFVPTLDLGAHPPVIERTTQHSRVLRRRSYFAILSGIDRSAQEVNEALDCCEQAWSVVLESITGRWERSRNGVQPAAVPPTGLLQTVRDLIGRSKS